MKVAQKQQHPRQLIKGLQNLCPWVSAERALAGWGLWVLLAGAYGCYASSVAIVQQRVLANFNMWFTAFWVPGSQSSKEAAFLEGNGDG